MIPFIDSREKKELLQQIRKMAETYTPEWRFDEEHPDFGTSLAMLFAEMFDGSVRRFNRIPEKYRIDFYNEIGASLLPAVASSGYVCFDIPENMEEGIPIIHGTQLTADADTEAGATVFETLDDVCAVRAKPLFAMGTNGKKDIAFCLYDLTEQVDAEGTGSFTFFDDAKENLQVHRMYLCGEEVLNLSESTWIHVTLLPYYKKKFSEILMKDLTDEMKITWEYYSEQGWSSFSTKYSSGDEILLYRDREQPAFARMSLMEKEGYWLRCTLKEFSAFEHMQLSGIQLSSEAGGLLPDYVFSDGMEQNISEFFAFGPMFSVYDELYIASNEVFCKKGARIQMDFVLRYTEVPLELDVADPAIDWKLIMKRSKIRPDQEYDITIENVIWEYYNGTGWAKLTELREQEKVFCFDNDSSQQGGKPVSFSFVCPSDITPVLAGPGESCCIRARVIKVNNAWKVKGQYISPVLENLTLQYTYMEHPVMPAYVVSENSLQQELITRRELMDQGCSFLPFQRTEGENSAVWLGFSEAPVGGPVRMLFQMNQILEEKPGRLIWEYWSSRGWKLLHVADETENLYRTGIVTFMSPADQKKERKWGKELYWIRITDGEDWYGNPEYRCGFPTAEGLYMNASGIRNVESGITEFFHVNPGENTYEYRLLNTKIQELKLEVLEEEKWTVWEEVADFADTKPGDCHYTLDRNEGIFRFPVSAGGKLPPSGDVDTIRVLYVIGGGTVGNLPKDAVNGSRVSLGAVSRISNPGILYGGCDIESPEEAAGRTAAMLRHKNRAVTTADFEALALEASRNILRVKCFSGYDNRGQRMPGAVTLVVLHRDYQVGGACVQEARRQIEKELRGHISSELAAHGRFFVTEPLFVELCIKAEVVVDSFRKIFPVTDAVKLQLDRFLDPTKGNFDGEGWKIGTLPNQTQLQNCLNKIPEIRYIRNLYVTAYMNNGTERVETDMDGAVNKVFVLPKSGIHEVDVSVDEGR